ncbi:unnamed protein product [Choristocarpus tenellus]
MTSRISAQDGTVASGTGWGTSYTKSTPVSNSRDKRWLKSVKDADKVEFFGDERFDATEYAQEFFIKHNASRATERCEQLEGMRHQTGEM